MTAIVSKGDYKVCLTNKKFNDKLIYMNIVSFFTEESLEKTLEAEKLNQTHTQLMVICYVLFLSFLKI